MKRIISKIQIKDNFQVQTIQFEGLRKIGDIHNSILNMYNQGIDEIYIQDVVASLYDRKFDNKLLNRSTVNCFKPISISGNINSLKTAKKLFANGADKLILNTNAIKNPKIINKLITEFGSQSIGVSIETKKIDNEWHCLAKGGRVVTKYKLKDWIAESIDRGCGEICLSSIDNQGKACGINLDLLDFVGKNNISVPLIIDGGFNNLNELLFFKDYTFVDGVIANTVFNKKIYTVRQIKSFLFKNKILCRP